MSPRCLLPPWCCLASDVGVSPPGTGLSGGGGSAVSFSVVSSAGVVCSPLLVVVCC